MRVMVIGGGPVGLVSALTAAAGGHQVTLVEVDQVRLDHYRAGEVPFHEPGAAELLATHAGELLGFQDHIGTDLAGLDVILVCVGTPPLADGSQDLSQVISALEELAPHLPVADGPVVAVRSTVVPGTHRDRLADIIPADRLVANPEFMREGSALADSLAPDRIVLGGPAAAVDRVEELWSADAPCVKLDWTAAELVKYTANAFLATKISFANEIANLAQRLDVDHQEVFAAVALDPRISPAFFAAGAGFGGSCFPKDVMALRVRMEELGLPPRILAAVLQVNEHQPSHLIDLAEQAFGPVADKPIAVLGLAFKPGTDDTRESRTIPLILELRSRGAQVVVQDPIVSNLPSDLPGDLVLTTDIRVVLDGAVGAFIMTAWPEYRDAAPEAWSGLAWMVDGRRALRQPPPGVGYIAL